jgi:hypothetical protein
MMAAFHDRPEMDNDGVGFAAAIAGRCKQMHRSINSSASQEKRYEKMDGHNSWREVKPDNKGPSAICAANKPAADRLGEHDGVDRRPRFLNGRRQCISDELDEMVFVCMEAIPRRQKQKSAGMA